MNISSVLRHRSHKYHYFKLLFSTNVDKIEIPKRIPRGPTDILKALERTVGRDPTAAHFKYHDDPYLIPKSNIGKRTFALAQEAGRKAAHWVRQQHPDLFQHREADPPVEKFFPPMVYNENSEVSEQDLVNLINNVQVSDAVLVYQLLKNKQVDVSPNVEQSLLELICYNNGEDTLSDEFIEERWFRQSSKGKERQRKTWNDGSVAEEIFINLDPPTAEAYSALIQGMAKYYQVDKAWELFEEAQKKGFIINVNAYNSILNVTNFLKESYELRWDFIMDLLSDMNRAQIKPNLGTLNAVLHTLSTMGAGQNTRDNTLKILSEFKKIGVTPSLGSWYYVLITFCKERGPISTILHDIMRQVENKEHQIQDISDTNFFVTAMDICRNHLNDANLAKRVNKLLHFGSNYNLIGDSYRESIYYRHYFILLCMNLPLDEFMSDVYNVLVPHIYVPEPSVMEEVWKQIDINCSVEYIPQLWSDLVIFDHTNRESLTNLVLNTMINNEQLPESELNKQFSSIAWDIYNKIESQHPEKINSLKFTGDMLGNIMILLLRNNEFEKSCKIMDNLNKNHATIIGVPKLEALARFVDICIEEKKPSLAIKCVQYCNDCGFPETQTMAAKLNDQLTLDEIHLNTLSKIVGNISIESSQ